MYSVIGFAWAHRGISARLDRVAAHGINNFLNLNRLF
jgi:hypothetical protein